LLCSLLEPPATSSLLGPNILLSVLSSNTQVNFIVADLHLWKLQCEKVYCEYRWNLWD
jgi:hypothetical protein